MIEYAKDIIERPAHLDVAFFEEVVENAARTSCIQLKRIVFEMGSNTGENYCSKIYRVRIDYARRVSNRKQEEDDSNADGGAAASTGIVDDQIDAESTRQISVIVKCIAQSESVEFIQDCEVFLKEKITYYDVLPRMQLLLANRRKLGPRIYQTLKHPENTLVFEDLGEMGYVLASREAGLDERHCRIVMQRMAEFHAASMALAKRDPQVAGCYTSGILSKAALEKDDGLLMRFLTGNIKQLHELVSGWPGYEGIAYKLQKYIAKLRENLVRCQTPLSGEIAVLNHGDLWVNNVLFKYDQTRSGIVSDVIFIDFQLSIWGSPGIDLNYFFYTSLLLDVLKHKRRALLEEYHKRLCETLQAMGLGSDAPTFEAILTEVRRRETFGFFAHFGIFPLISMDKESSNDTSFEGMDDPEFAKKKCAQMFASKRLADNLRYTLKHFDEVGVFD